jgi:hypothetical protein
MKLLFKAGSDIKSLLGYVDSDINFKNLEPDLRTATNDIIDLIGEEIYDKAVELYNNGEIADENKDFLLAIRYPIAVNAYRLMAPTSDVAHTNNGRKARQDDGEKQVFEWMLDRDNAAQEKRYYRALDDLIKYLEKQPLVSPLKVIWINSEAFKKSHELFIRTVSEFNNFYTIDSRLLLLKLQPGISDCELYEIRPRIGSKFEELKLKLKNEIEITDIKDLQLLRLIKRATAYSSLAWAMARFSVQLLPEGILQHYTSDRGTTQSKKPSLKSEVEATRQAFQSDADKALAEIEKMTQPEPEPIDDIQIIPDINCGDKYFST